MPDVVSPIPAARRRDPALRLMIGATPLACVLAVAGCASAPPAVSPVPVPASKVPAPPVIPQATWQQKIGWIVRLEDQRLIRVPAPPAPATALTAPPPSDLVVLLTDREPVVRARAALALGRAGLPEAVDPLARLLADAD